MALPTSDEIKKLDVAYRAMPFVGVSTGSTTTLDVARLGVPFVGAYGASGGYVGMNESITVLPSLVAASSGGSGLAGSSSQTLLAITGTGAGGEPLRLPRILAEGHGASGSIGGSDAELATIKAAGHAIVGGLGRSAEILPSIEGTGYGPPISNQILPSIQGESSGVVGQIGNSSIALPSIQSGGMGRTPTIGGSVHSLLPIRASGSGITGNVGASIATLSRLIVASQGVTGTVGSSTLTLPVITADSDGHVQIVGASSITLPSIIAVSTGAIPVSTEHQGYALQTQVNALTTFSNVPFNSFAQFNKVYLAAGPCGLFILEGDTDAGAEIQASAKTGLSDFETPEIKRIEAMYVNYRTDGELSLKVIADDTTEYDYPLEPHGSERLNTTRTRIGKGLAGVYWQFEISNVNGADFEIERMEPRIAKSMRRIA